jgi:hypothetical protein
MGVTRNKTLLFLPPHPKRNRIYTQRGVIIPLLEYLILNHLRTAWHIIEVLEMGPRFCCTQARLRSLDTNRSTSLDV